MITRIAESIITLVFVTALAVIIYISITNEGGTKR